MARKSPVNMLKWKSTEYINYLEFSQNYFRLLLQDDNTDEKQQMKFILVVSLLINSMTSTELHGILRSLLDFTIADKGCLLSDNALLLPLLVGAVSIESSCTPSK